MTALSLEDFDNHIQNLRAQVAFLTSSLDAADHNAPDWLPADLIALRNKSGRLQDDMQRFRDQIGSEGLASKGTSNKRLSLEGAKPDRSRSNSTYATNPSVPRDTPPSPNPQPPTPKQSRPGDDFVVQHIDVTEEVNRRLQESRLRRLMDSPSTSQKRKYHTIAPPDAGNGGGQRDGEDDREELLDRERSPKKKLRASTGFEERLKRKESVARGDGNGIVEQSNYKRRRI